MKKAIFKSSKGEVHFGVNAPTNDFAPAAKADVEKFLKSLGKRKLWRCNVCNDLHIGLKPPQECPTCHSIDSYVEVGLKEFRTVIGL